MSQPITDDSSVVDDLVVGDGNLSFSAALVQSYANAGERRVLWATVYDALPTAIRRYGELVNECLAQIMDNRGVAYDQVDARLIHHLFPGATFRRIWWNFPHPGWRKGRQENAPEVVQAHVNLMDEFFHSCSQVQVEGGEVMITIIRYPPVTVERLAQLAGAHGYDLRGRKAFDPAEYPTYTRVWGDDRDGSSARQEYLSWDVLAQRLTFMKRSTERGLPEQYHSLASAIKGLDADSVSRRTLACLQYRAPEGVRTAHQLSQFIRQRLAAHIRNLQGWLQRPICPFHCLALTFLPMDTHPRKQAFQIADALTPLLDLAFGPFRTALVDVPLLNWKVACCVEVASAKRPILLIHVLPPQEMLVQDGPDSWCRFKTALVLMPDYDVYRILRDQYCAVMGLRVSERPLCMVDIFAGGAVVDICPDAEWLPHVGGRILREAFRRLRAGAPCVRIPDIQTDLHITTRQGIPFLFPLHRPHHVAGVARESGLMDVAPDGTVMLLSEGYTLTVSAGLSRLAEAEEQFKLSQRRPCGGQGSPGASFVHPTSPSTQALHKGKGQAVCDGSEPVAGMNAITGPGNGKGNAQGRGKTSPKPDRKTKVKSPAGPQRRRGVGNAHQATLVYDPPAYDSAHDYPKVS
mmetsp:Transcript_97475/g.168097  ORF Transcript_97475/g.168097 Transcript_97475/m.168097 type:complete len:633 (-) Transcript_97475:38-1936(-)